MALANSIHKVLGFVDPMSRVIDPAYSLLKPKTPPPAPGVVNPNDALNASQSQTDAMRMRRGMLSNIYAGGQAGPAPVTGKVTLGT